jgi:membrane dipeptidase
MFLDEDYATAAREVLYSLAAEYDAIDRTLPPIPASYAKDRLQCVALQQRVAPMSYHRLADHIEYIARLVGAEHVGLGSDYDGINCVPEGLETGASLPLLTAELARRGFNDQELEQILGGNVLRVMQANEA